MQMGGLGRVLYVENRGQKFLYLPVEMVGLGSKRPDLGPSHARPAI